MMSESRSCMFLLLSAVAGLLSVSGVGITVKYVCPGDSVQAFQNIEFNHCNANVSLNINGDTNAEIAEWSIQYCIRNENIQPEYQGRLIFDQNGTITIKNFNHFDQAKYVVISKMDPLPKIYEVQLSLMVAPTKACKPTIEQLENNLIASLKANDCGKPVAIPYWKDYDGVSNTNRPMLKLTPGMEAKEYYACITGVALTCVKNVTSHDYCTKFIMEGSKSPPASLETCHVNALIAVCIILGILLFLAILAPFIRYHLRKKNANDEQTIMSLGTPKLWTKHFGKLDWEDIRKLLNDDKQMGKQTYCDNLKSQNDNPRREEERQGDAETDGEEVCTELLGCNDPDKIKEFHEFRNAIRYAENDREEASTEQQGCIDPDKIKELTELRGATLCKICLCSKMSVFFLPCWHIATCSKCSSFLPRCPVCRGEIKEKLTISFD